MDIRIFEFVLFPEKLFPIYSKAEKWLKQEINSSSINNNYIDTLVTSCQSKDSQWDKK